MVAQTRPQSDSFHRVRISIFIAALAAGFISISVLLLDLHGLSCRPLVCLVSPPAALDSSAAAVASLINAPSVSRLYLQASTAFAFRLGRLFQTTRPKMPSRPLQSIQIRGLTLTLGFVVLFSKLVSGAVEEWSGRRRGP